MSRQINRIKRQENLSACHRSCFIAGLLQAPRAFKQESFAARGIFRAQAFGKSSRLPGARALQESEFHLVKVPTPVSEELAGCCLFAGQQPAAEPPWHTDYAKALAAARQSGKPIFALFH